MPPVVVGESLVLEKRAAPAACNPSVLFLPPSSPPALVPPIAAMLLSLLAAILAADLAPKPGKLVGVGAIMLALLTPADDELINFLGLFLAL